MKYEWDNNKYKSNLLKHGIRFEDAQTVFADAQALELEIFESNEVRFILLGMSLSRGILVVVYCERDGDTVRIISARKATRTEQGEYEKRY